MRAFILSPKALDSQNEKETLNILKPVCKEPILQNFLKINLQVALLSLLLLLIAIVEKILHAVRGPHKTDKDGILFLYGFLALKRC